MSDRRADPTAVGIGLAFAGMLLLTLTPVVGRWAEVPPSFAAMALGAAILLMLIGAAVGLIGGREHSASATDDEDPGEAPPQQPG